MHDVLKIKSGDPTREAFAAYGFRIKRFGQALNDKCWQSGLCGKTIDQKGSNNVAKVANMTDQHQQSSLLPQSMKNISIHRGLE